MSLDDKATQRNVGTRAADGDTRAETTVEFPTARIADCDIRQRSFGS
jgi:hypothetical protein